MTGYVASSFECFLFCIYGTVGPSFVEFCNCHINCQDCMIFKLHILDFENRKHAKFQFSWMITFRSAAVEQPGACSPITQWSRVRTPVGISFLGEVF